MTVVQAGPDSEQLSTVTAVRYSLATLVQPMEARLISPWTFILFGQSIMRESIPIRNL